MKSLLILMLAASSPLIGQGPDLSALSAFSMLSGRVERIDSVSLEPDGRLVVQRRVIIPSNAMYACNPPRPMPDSVFVYRDIYAVVNGKITLLKTEEAKYTHASEETVRTPEKIEWPATP